MNALKTAAREILDQCCADLRVVVHGLDAEALAWTPAPETSSIGTLVRHPTSATRFLLSSAATGHGDREHYRNVERAAAFAARETTADELIGLVDALEEDARRLVAETPLDRLDDAIVFQSPDEQPATRAWAFLHAIDHLREHVGHAQLTRQMIRTED